MSSTLATPPPKPSVVDDDDNVYKARARLIGRDDLLFAFAIRTNVELNVDGKRLFRRRRAVEGKNVEDNEVLP